MANTRGKPMGPREPDPNAVAKSMIDQIARRTEGVPEPVTVRASPSKSKAGKVGGQKGGPARAAKLTQEERASIAKKAAEARWGNP